MILTDECPSRIETRSISIPSMSSSTASVSRKRWGWPSTTPAISHRRRKARRQFPESVSFDPTPVQNQWRGLRRGHAFSASTTKGGSGTYRHTRLLRVEENTRPRSGVVQERVRVVVRGVCGPPNLATSTCTRTLGANGALTELVHLNGGRDGLSDQDLERFLESFPIQRD